MVIVLQEPTSNTGTDCCRAWSVAAFSYVEYLQQFDLRQKRYSDGDRVLRRIYRMQRAKSITSIENHRSWFEAVSRMKNENVRLILDETGLFLFQIRRETEGFAV